MRRLLRMRLENFLSFRELDFDFEDAGFVLVEGRNGAGKSALVDGVLWCLFKKTLRGYEDDDVVHRRVGKDCLVTLEFENGDDVYRVGRARKHSKLKNSVVLYQNDVEVTAAGEKEVQLQIEDALGCSYKTFLSSVVFGQDRAYRFSSLTDGEQKKILDEVLGVERFADACAAARKVASKLQDDEQDAQRALAKATESRDEAEAEAVDLEVKNVDFAEEQGKKIAAVRVRLTEAKKWLKHNVVRDAAEAKRKIESARARVSALEKSLATARSARAAALSKRDVVDSRVEDLSAQIGKHESAGGKCPTCGQDVKKRHQQLGMADLKRQLSEQEKVLESANEALRLADAAEASAQRDLADARETERGLVADHAEAAGAEANAKAWRQRVVDCEKRIAELEATSNPYAALAEKARSRRDRHEKDVEAVTEEIGVLEGKIRRAQFWVKAFGNAGLRSLLLDTSLPLLNDEAARVSRALTGGSIAIEFSATTEQKSGKVVDRFEVRVDNKRGAADYAGNSSGERAKVDLCVGLALQRLVASRSSASFNVAVFDEVFDHLDSAAHEPVIEVLSELDKESVYVVSHDDDLKAWFPAALRVVKRGDASVVETDA